MGNACCVAARDKMVLVVPPNSSAAETERRRHSPTWSFRWDNNNNNRGGGGGRVAGEDSSLSWLSDGISRNDGSDFKFESPFVSSHGSPPSLDCFQTRTLLKSPPSGNSFLLLLYIFFILELSETHVWCYSLGTSKDFSSDRVKMSLSS